MKFLHAVLMGLMLVSCGDDKKDETPPPVPPLEKVSTEALMVETSAKLSEAPQEKTCEITDEFFLSYTKDYLSGLSLEVNCTQIQSEFFTSEELESIPQAQQITCGEERQCFKSVVTFSNGQQTDRYYVIIVRFNNGANGDVLLSDKRNKHFLPLTADEVEKGQLLHDNLAGLRASLDAWITR